MTNRNIDTDVFNNELHPPPPSTAILKDSRQVDTSSEVWVLGKGNHTWSIKFLSIYDICSSEIQNSIKWTIYTRLSIVKYTSVYKEFSKIKRFLLFARKSNNLTVNAITLADMMNYKSQSVEEFRHLRSFFRTWVKYGFCGIGTGVKEFLERKHADGRKAVDLEAVRTLNPETGPLLELEENLFRKAVLGLFNRDEISISSFCLIMLILNFGSRPEQISKLKLKHLIVYSIPSGHKSCVLQIPWAKQGKEKTPVHFPLTQTLAEAMIALSESVRIRFPSHTLPESMAWDELPFFPAIKNNTPISNEGRNLAKSVIAIGEKTNITSPRPELADRRIRITARRLRHTTATRLAQRGKYTARQIADYLQQVDEKSCQPYVDIVENLLRDFNEYWGTTLTHYANKALNIISEDENISGPRIMFSENGCLRSDLGKCGKTGCRALIPLACYGCDRFRPLLNAPHEDYLNTLLNERDRLLEVDPNHVAIYDEVIWHLRLTIQACDQIKKDGGK